MGNRSDNQYHGTHDPKDWTKGLNKTDRPLTDDEIAAAAVNSAAELKNRPANDRILILREQLPKFKETGNRYSREYCGEAYAEMLKPMGKPFALLTNAGLSLQDISCASDSFPVYTNLQALVDAAKGDFPTLNPRTKAVKNDTLTVSLTKPQFDQVKRFYQTGIGSPGL